MADVNFVDLRNTSFCSHLISDIVIKEHVDIKSVWILCVVCQLKCTRIHAWSLALLWSLRPSSLYLRKQKTHPFPGMENNVPRSYVIISDATVHLNTKPAATDDEIRQLWGARTETTITARGRRCRQNNAATRKTHFNYGEYVRIFLPHQVRCTGWWK